MTTVAVAASDPRFESVVHDGWPTVRDNEAGTLLVHEAPWTPEFAARVARDLVENPGPAYLLTWGDE